MSVNNATEKLPVQVIGSILGDDPVLQQLRLHGSRSVSRWAVVPRTIAALRTHEQDLEKRRYNLPKFITFLLQEIV